MMPERLATCCYCGRRTALRHRDHALACGSCGAPLTQMKRLRPAQAGAVARHAPTKLARPVKKRRKSKSFMSRLVEEIIDEIEDIFD